MLFIVVLFIATLFPESSLIGLRKPAGCDFFTRQNASKILGAEVTWTGTDSTESEPKKWTCTFAPKEAADGAKVFFVLHRFDKAESALKEFDAIVQSNKEHAGFEKWAGVGDDAIIHTDGAKFQFVMVRKGNRSFRIKVNPSGSTSLDHLKLVAQDLTRKLEEMEGEE